MAKNELTKDDPTKEKKSKDDKKKRDFNTWSYYLAWLAFFAALAAAFVKLVEKWELPKKDDYYK